MKLNIIIAALAAPLAAFADVATGVWTTGTWTEFTRAENSLLRPRYLDTDAGSDKTDVFFCDGTAQNPIGTYFSGNRAVTWKFPSAATVYGARFYTSWQDGGRDGIIVTSMDVKYSEDGEWTSLENSQIDYNPAVSGKSQLTASFAAEDGSPIAEGVVAVRFVFPKQDHGGAAYLEMEVLGELAEHDPDPEPDLEWNAGGFDKTAWEPLVAESNMMKYCSFIYRNGADATTSYAGMMNKTIAEYSSYILNNDTMTFKFANPIYLQSFSIFAGWRDGGRDSVAVLGFETQDENGEWTKHFGVQDEECWCVSGSPFGDAIDTATAKVGANYGTLRRKDGTPIATGVCAIRVYSYYGDSAGACWLEVEAEGWIEETNAIFDETSITFSNDCWDATWTAKLTSLGASDEATVNLWTSLDNVTFTKVATQTVTETDVAYEFKHTFDDVDQKIWYRFETVNSKGETTWYTTNAVNTAVNYDNATYAWRADGASGAWEDDSNWTNSRSDSRLKWPTHEYTTADFSGLASGAETVVTVGAAHSPKMKFAPAGASLTLKGESSVTLTMKNTDFAGCVTVDGMALAIPKVTFGDGARLVAKNGAKVTAPGGLDIVGLKSGIELLSDATLSIGSVITRISGDSEIVLNGGSVPAAGYFTWAGATKPQTARIVFGPLGGVFKAPQTHRMLESGVCTLRYELPGGRWNGYSEAPLQPTKVNNDHQFGSGTFRVEVVDGEAEEAKKDLELPLIELPQNVIAGNTIVTNNFSFMAFGNEMEVGVPNSKGDYFYWTYDGGDATEPAEEGTLPSGLRFHHASRGIGLVIQIR